MKNTLEPQSFTATHLLRDDHKKIKGLIRQLEAAPQRAREMTSGVLKELCMELEIHGVIEKELFYPALIDATDDISIRFQIEQGLAAHDEISNLMTEFEGLQQDETRFKDKFQELTESVELHIKDEEEILLAQADTLLGGQLIELGNKMMERRSELIQLPQYQSAQPEVVQNPNGGEQMRKREAA